MLFQREAASSKKKSQLSIERRNNIIIILSFNFKYFSYCWRVTRVASHVVSLSVLLRPGLIPSVLVCPPRLPSHLVCPVLADRRVCLLAVMKFIQSHFGVLVKLILFCSLRHSPLISFVFPSMVGRVPCALLRETREGPFGEYVLINGRWWTLVAKSSYQGCLIGGELQ